MKKVNKFTVSAEAFQDARHLPCFKIPYICTTETEFPKQFDFILINDKNGNEIVRNFMKAEENVLEYTSCFHGDKCDDISLTVIMTFLYQSIMWIRHGTYIEKRLFSRRNFPTQRLEREIYLISNTLNLCEGKINIRNFINILEQYESNSDDFVYFSAVDILENYNWQFEMTELRKEKILLLKSAIDEINDLLKDKAKWKEVHKVGYRIHNEPYFIYENTNNY